MWNMVTPGMPLRAITMGTRTRKVAHRLLLMVNRVRPQPLKKPLRQNTKHTRRQSML